MVHLCRVADTGVDWHNCYFAPASGSPPFNSVDLSARKVLICFSCSVELILQIVAYYELTGADQEDDFQGHGTHVCGSVLGKECVVRS